LVGGWHFGAHLVMSAYQVYTVWFTNTSLQPPFRLYIQYSQILHNDLHSGCNRDPHFFLFCLRSVGTQTYEDF
jgi:hypothetical protein